MKSYDTADIRRALDEVGIEPGGLVLMHSALFPLGRFAGEVSEIVAALLDVLTEEGTLVVPTFTFDVCGGAPFDRRRSISTGMGVLSEAVRTHADARRSPHSMQSVAAIGTMRDEICGRDTAGAFQLGGSFDLMIERDIRLLLFGATIEAASLTHFSEERSEVPYRYWKTFTTQYTDDGATEERGYDMYVRDIDIDPRLRLRNLEERMDPRGMIRRARLGMGVVASCSAHDFHSIATTMLAEDPFALLDNRDEVARHYA